MKYLLYGINFAPEVTCIGKYTGEMAAWLAEQGHEVRVVTAPPYYPSWKVGKGYRAWQYRVEDYHGAAVWRCPLWVPRKPGGLARLIHLFSFAAFSLPVLLRQALWRPDVVWVAAPAFACTPGALMVAGLSGAASWLHVQDYEVDVAFDTGLLRGRRLRQWVTGAERWVLRRFDVVSSISQRMLQRAREKGVEPARVNFLPNWVDIDAVRPLKGRSAYRDELGISDDEVVALFSGSLGAKQGLQMIPEAAALLAERCPQVTFVVGGEGVMKPMLEAAAARLPNLKLLPLQPKERLPELLGMADVHLLTQDQGVADLVMPSKLTAMLSSGRAVVTTARAGTEVGDVVARCGLLATTCDGAGLADAVEALARKPAERAARGAAGRIYAVEHLGQAQVLQRFVDAAAKLRVSRRATPDEPTVTDFASKP